MVPISAHALFARPLVVAPTSVLAVEVLARTDGAGVLWCDGRRTVDLPPGARIEVRRGERPVRLARLHDAPFTDRLVAKFGLPVEGWRGSAERRAGRGARMIEEIRITSLGVIEASTLELGPGLTVITGETGRRQDDGRHRARPAPRRARRQRRRARRRPDRPRRGRGRHRRPAGPGRPRSRTPAARSRTSAWCWPATSRPRAAPAPSSAARRCRSRRWPRSPSRWSPCTASPTSTGCCSRGPSARPSTASAAPPLAALLESLDRPASTGCVLWRPSSRTSSRSARERAREADLLRFGLGEVEAVSPEPGEDGAAGGRGVAAGLRRHAAHRRRAGPRGALQRGRRPRRAGHQPRPPAPPWRPCASTTPRPARWPTGSPR